MHEPAQSIGFAQLEYQLDPDSLVGTLFGAHRDLQLFALNRDQSPPPASRTPARLAIAMPGARPAKRRHQTETYPRSCRSPRQLRRFPLGDHPPRARVWLRPRLSDANGLPFPRAPKIDRLPLGQTRNCPSPDPARMAGYRGAASMEIGREAISRSSSKPQLHPP